MRQNFRGFTLLELIVVIAIIGVLSVLVLPSFKSALDNSKIGRAKIEMEEITKTIIIAQNQSSKTLVTMTSNGCADCACRSGNLKNDTGTCYSQSLGTFNSIETNTGGFVSGMSRLVRDPWGSPYLFDANQGEYGAPSCSTVDGFRSVGPDGTYGTSDDIIGSVPLAGNCP